MKRRIKNKKLKQTMQKAIKELMDNECIGLIKQQNNLIVKFDIMYLDYPITDYQYPEMIIHARYKP